MTVTLDIREYGRVVYVTFADPLDAREMYPLFDQDRLHRDQFRRTHPDEKIHLLVDFMQAKMPVQGLLQARHSPSLTHPTSGYIVLIGGNLAMKRVAEAVFRIGRFKRNHFFDHPDKAWFFIRNAIREEDQSQRAS